VVALRVGARGAAGREVDGAGAVASEHRDARLHPVGASLHEPRRLELADARVDLLAPHSEALREQLVRHETEPADEPQHVGVSLRFLR
jgi:hypothetical protein